MPDQEPASDDLRDRQELEAHLIHKAWKDPKFRQALLANPRAVLQQEIELLSPGVKIPDGVEVTVHEESLTRIHVVLPMNSASAELSDEELDLVAGGWSTGCGEKVCGCQFKSCSDKSVTVPIDLPSLPSPVPKLPGT